MCYKKVFYKHEKNGFRYGIQGGPGSFNEEAFLYYINTAAKTQFQVEYLYTTKKVLSYLSAGQIDYGLFAIFNSVGGLVHESSQEIASHKFHIVQELSIPIRHVMMKRKSIMKEQIDTIMTHPQVIKQCYLTLQKRHSNLSLTHGTGDFMNTARVAMALAKGELPATTAVIGSHRLSTLYDLEIIDENLQDDSENTTTFWLVSGGKQKPDI